MDAFQQYCEQWAENYPKMKHVPGPDSPNQRFFYTFGYAGMTDAMKGLDPTQSPCMMMDVNVSDRTSEGWQYKDYTIYFCVRAYEQGDARAASPAVDAAINIKDDFIVDIEKLRKVHPVVGLIDTGNLNGTTMGPFFDGWICYEISLEVPQQKNLCR